MPASVLAGPRRRVAAFFVALSGASLSEVRSMASRVKVDGEARARSLEVG